MTLQFCVGFCHTATWISPCFMYICPFPPEPPSPFPSCSRGHHREPGWAPCGIKQLPTVYLTQIAYICHCYFINSSHPHLPLVYTSLLSAGFSSVQSLSRVWLFATPWTTAHQASQSITNSQSSPKPISIESVMSSNHLILCHPLLLLPSIFPSIRVFSNESAFRIRWTQYWSFSFNISTANEHPGLTSFRMDRLDLLAVQGTLKSLLQHHSSKASILQCSVFFIVQLSHPYMTTGKTIALTRWTFVGKVMSLLLNILSRWS